MDEEEKNTILIQVKKIKPVRSYSGEISKSISKNKELLRIDFSRRCCYCDDLDEIRSSKDEYQVEHFAPKSKFPKLKFRYNNLLYCCRTCNRGKWDKWPSDDEKISVVGNIGFLDPCDDQYYDNIARKSTGEIVYLTELGKYIYETLNLSLGIHVICYKLEKYKSLIEEINIKLNSNDLSLEKREKLEELKKITNDEFFKYYLKKINNDFN